MPIQSTIDGYLLSPIKLGKSRKAPYWQFKLAIDGDTNGGPSQTLCQCQVLSERLAMEIAKLATGSAITCTGLLSLNGWVRKDGKNGTSWLCNVLSVQTTKLRMDPPDIQFTNLLNAGTFIEWPLCFQQG